jgi:hypothetical protein
MKEIQLTQGMFAKVDDERFKELNRFNWQIQKMGKLQYASTTLRLPTGKQFKCQMHWAVLGLHPPKGLVVDHIDGDGLNNQEANLRVVYCRQNCQNKHKTYSSKYPGVSFHKLTSKWIVHISIGGKVKHLGSFVTEEEAFKAYSRIVAVCGQTVIKEND